MRKLFAAPGRAASYDEGMQAIPMLRGATDLAHRFQEGETFRPYVVERLPLVAAVLLVFVVLGAGCAAAVVVLAVSASKWLALPAFVLAPLVLIAAVFVQGYAFLVWLEDRAIARSLARTPDLRRGLHVVLAALQWPLAAPALLVPVTLLAIASPATAAVLLLAAAGAPFLFAALDS